MRVGDVSVQLIPVGGGERVEGADGRVLARPKQVYTIRITNHSRLRAVVKVNLDGHPVTEGGLVLDAGETMELERPVTAGEHGRFTVFAEGTEAVFGEDGGRGNPDLGLVEVEHRRELERPRPPVVVPRVASPPPRPAPEADLTASFGSMDYMDQPLPSSAPPAPMELYDLAMDAAIGEGDVQGAAGTGLTGHSSQTFHPVEVGPLEAEATWVRLRIVIGRPEAFDRPRPLPGVSSHPVPPRPDPRP